MPYGVPYGTGSCTYCACIAKVAFLSIFQFFFYNLHDLPQKKLHALTAKIKKFNFFFIIHTTYRKKKNYTHLPQKNNYTTRRFFCTRLTFFTNTTQHNTLQHNTTQHNTTQHNTTQHNTTQHNTTQHNTTQHNTTQHNTTQHNTTQHNTTQHNTTQHNTTQHNTTQLNTRNEIVAFPSADYKRQPLALLVAPVPLPSRS